MSYRLYAHFEPIYARVGRQYNDIDKALKAARKVASAIVEIRELLPNGREVLWGILRDGRPVNAV